VSIVTIALHSTSLATAYVNGALRATFDPRDFSAQTTLKLGGTLANGQGSFKGWCCEWVVCNADLTSAQRRAAEMILSEKWDVPLEPV
jgi:hypothetical protein